MHTNYQTLRSQVDQIWDALWTGGLSNPMDAIEQLSFLLFLKMMEDEENQRERQARRRGVEFVPTLPDKLRWSYWTNLQAEAALKHLKETVFPTMREMGEEGSSFRQYMATAECKINRPNLLITVARLIDQMDIAAQEADVKGDIYEYMLSYLTTSGRNGQFRTPRHIIRMMVEMIGPKPNERIGDLAAGTCGFLVGAYQYILEQHTSPEILYDEGGGLHRVGDRLTDEQRAWLNDGALRGYDNDSGMTMLRIGSMNLILHGIDNPRFFYADTLSKDYDEVQDYDVILMNPPFKGAVNKHDVNEALPSNTTKSELLFLHRILRSLDMGGRCAVIVPDGVLFGSSRAHFETRKKIIEKNQLEGVVSMPSGVFKPYAGVSTAVLFFTRGGTTGDIWFYDMTHDGFSLDDKRQPTPENDIPDILECWGNRKDEDFATNREAQLADLQAQIAPLYDERLRLESEINRLTFEQTIAAEGETHAVETLDAVRAELDALHEQIAPLKDGIDRLTRQFWVSKEDVKANKYDLSTSRYRQVDQEPVYYEQPRVTMSRIEYLGRIISKEVQELMGLLNE